MLPIGSGLTQIHELERDNPCGYMALVDQAGAYHERSRVQRILNRDTRISRADRASGRNVASLVRL
jgi:hypothetical protein